MPYTPPDLHDHDLTDALSAANVKAWLATVATYADGLFVPEALHVVGAGGEPAYASPFEAGTAAFYKDPFGVVHLSGAVEAGAGASGSTHAAFVLPSGYRPAAPIYAACFIDQLGNHYPDATSIASDGTVSVSNVGNGVGEGDLFYLDGISFRAA